MDSHSEVNDATIELVRKALERVLARGDWCGCSGSGACSQSPAGGASAASAGAATRDGVAAIPGEPEPAGVRGFRGDVVLAGDHGGFALKEDLVAFLREQGYRVRDLGPATDDACDYPDYALRVAKAVAKGEAWRGIVVDGVGIGSAMAAGKVPGIRAATCFDEFSTRNSRGHNNANVMCLGSRVLEPALARKLATVFLETEFEGGRHARRVDKITEIERAFTTPVFKALEQRHLGGGRS